MSKHEHRIHQERVVLKSTSSPYSRLVNLRWSLRTSRETTRLLVQATRTYHSFRRSKIGSHRLHLFLRERSSVRAFKHSFTSTQIDHQYLSFPIPIHPVHPIRRAAVAHRR